MIKYYASSYDINAQKSHVQNQKDQKTTVVQVF